MRPVVREALRIFSARGARFLGAAVAFYALISAAPLFVVLIHVVGSLFGRARAESALFSGLGTWLTPGGLTTIRAMTERLDRTSSSGSVLGVVLVVYGSTRLFRAVRRALNQLWGIDLEAIERARPRAKRYAIRYGAAFALLLFTAVLVSAILVVKALFGIVGTLGAEPAPALLWIADTTTSTGLAFVLFVALFRLLPETRVTWREAAKGALVSTALFAAGSVAVSLYLRHKQIDDLYGGASAVVLAVFWVYYSAQVFFLGACFGAATRECAGRR